MTTGTASADNLKLPAANGSATNGSATNGSATNGSATNGSATNGAATAAKSRFRIDPRYIAPMLITCVLLGANFYGGVLESPWKTALAIVVSLLTEMAAGKLTTGKIPHLASAYVTGISVGILVRSPWFWPYAVCAAISILTKHVIRVKGRHIWNPSNFGIVWLLFLVPQAVAPLSIQWDNSLAPMIVIWVLGSFVISRARRFHICLTYVISFLLFAALRCAITHQPYLAEISPITGPMYQLFTFFMITDPKTTVQSKKGQILVTVIIAFVEFIFRLCQLVDAPFYALFLVGPIANLVEIRQMAKKSDKAGKRERGQGYSVNR